VIRVDRVGTLCHYTTAEAAFEHIVPSGELRLSPYSRMRDPLENHDLAFGGAGFRTDIIDETYSRVMDMIRRTRNEVRLLSFTVDATEGYSERDTPFQRAWARARLWEQYAEKHAGVCLVFDREKASGSLWAAMHRLGTPMRREVRYTPCGFRDTPAATLNLDSFDLDNLAADVARFTVDHEQDLFFAKTLDWQSEHEFRFTLVPNEEPGLGRTGYVFVDYGASLIEVILGEKFPAWQIPAARDICGRNGVKLSQLLWENGRPWPKHISRASD